MAGHIAVPMPSVPSEEPDDSPSLAVMGTPTGAVPGTTGPPSATLQSETLAARALAFPGVRKLSLLTTPMVYVIKWYHQ